MPRDQADAADGQQADTGSGDEFADGVAFGYDGGPGRDRGQVSCFTV